MDEKRYSQSQVLCGLRDAWEEVTGTDDDFDGDTQIYELMKADGSWDDLDLADVFIGLERFFGFTCTREEWRDFFRFDVANRNFKEWERDVAPTLTFGALATFIAARTPVIASFEPAPVFGRGCAAAGAFMGIEQLAQIIGGNRRRFAPSTPIIHVLRGDRLDRVWTQLRWRTDKPIPALPKVWREATFWGACCAFLTMLAATGAAWITADAAILVLPFAVAVLMGLAGFVYKELVNPLPPHIVSFRDLSMLIQVGQRDSRKDVETN